MDFMLLKIFFKPNDSVMPKRVLLAWAGLWAQQKRVDCGCCPHSSVQAWEVSPLCSNLTDLSSALVLPWPLLAPSHMWLSHGVPAVGG